MIGPPERRRTDVGPRLIGLLVGASLGVQGATQFVGWTYGYALALGGGTPIGETTRLYPPWSLLIWKARFGAEIEQTLARAAPIVLLGTVLGLGAGVLAEGDGRLRRIRGWGGLKEAARAGLRADGGAVIGLLRGRLLATADLRPTLVTGGTRSGKGRGHVVPTLLSWGGSVLVHDPKRELWSLTAGWRATFSHALFLDPRDPASARWNPLAEIRPGPGELAQVQRLVAILADPGGARDDEAIWDKAASEILEAVILHVLYSAPDDAKTLLTVRSMLADLDASADTMLKALHRAGPGDRPETHPFIKTAVTGYAAMHDRFRTSVQGTARSYLKWLAGEDLERVLSGSDLTLSDLMCADRPVSLYVQAAPADAVALRPLMRLLFYAAAQALTTDADRDAAGRAKRHRLLRVMDEFPLLGRLAFFEKSLRLMSGYGIKPMLVAQSLNDIVETYGPNNTILDNCHVLTAFSALDPLTQDKVSKLTGNVGEARVSRSGPAGLGGGRASVSRSEVDRPLLEPGEVRALPDHRQLVFAAGRRPILADKLKYDRREPFRRRAAIPAPAQTAGLDAPVPGPHPWAGRRALGQDAQASLPLFKEVAAVLDEKKVAQKVAEIFGRVTEEMAAQEAALDQLQGARHAQD